MQIFATPVSLDCVVDTKDTLMACGSRSVFALHSTRIPRGLPFNLAFVRSIVVGGFSSFPADDDCHQFIFVPTLVSYI